MTEYLTKEQRWKIGMELGKHGLCFTSFMVLEPFKQGVEFLAWYGENPFTRLNLNLFIDRVELEQFKGSIDT